MSRAVVEKPADPRMYRARVVRSERVTPSFQRVTVAGSDLAEFAWLGFDHWFRLFFPLAHQTSLRLPRVTGSGWWKEYLAIPEAERPHCSNYTVGDFRAEAGELDIDFVVHLNAAGDLEGRAAIWACGAQPGDELALLDQGVLFAPPADTSSVVVAADESGLPAVAGVLRSLPQDAIGRVIQEVPSAADFRSLPAPAGVDVSWVVRAPSAVPGATALRELQQHPAADPLAYGFVIGESSLATGGRRHLRRLGVPKERITFSGFWRH